MLCDIISNMIQFFYMDKQLSNGTTERLVCQKKWRYRWSSKISRWPKISLELICIKCYSLINMRQLQNLFNQAKTWHLIVCWFLCSSAKAPKYLSLPSKMDWSCKANVFEEVHIFIASHLCWSLQNCNCSHQKKKNRVWKEIRYFSKNL